MGAMRKSTHTPEYAIVRAELRGLREGAGLSQRDLATRLKVPHSWVSKIESGERRIDVVELCWLIRACDADPVHFFATLAERVVKRRSPAAEKRGRAK